MEFKEVSLESGKTLKFPIFAEKDITMGMRRKTRSFSPDRATEEILWLMLEDSLTEEELTAWDTLTQDEMAEALESAGGDLKD